MSGCLGRCIDIEILEGVVYPAYIPNALPDKIIASDKIFLLSAKAAEEIGKVSALSGRMDNPDLILMPFIGQEALSSSRIEGKASSSLAGFHKPEYDSN